MEVDEKEQENRNTPANGWVIEAALVATPDRHLARA
jgi:hypothetical protein